MTTDQAREYLKEQYGVEFHHYIRTKLAGDFAVALATKQQKERANFNNYVHAVNTAICNMRTLDV